MIAIAALAIGLIIGFVLGSTVHKIESLQKVNDLINYIQSNYAGTDVSEHSLKRIRTLHILQSLQCWKKQLRGRA